MCHGWPDSAALWNNTVQVLAERYRCVRFSWPGFEPDDGHQGLPSLDALMQQLHAVVLQANGGQPVTLLLHDWGCVFGYHYARLYPHMVVRVAGLDIGDAGSHAHQASLTGKQKLMVVGYQLWLALAWRIGGGLGDRMARRMAKAMKVPVAPERLHARMGWPYWLTWTGGLKAVRPFNLKLPTFFAYGQRKPFMFHSQAWCDALAQQPGCRALGLRAGHWLMLDAAPAFHEALLQWLQETDAQPAKPASP